MDVGGYVVGDGDDDDEEKSLLAGWLAGWLASSLLLALTCTRLDGWRRRRHEPWEQPNAT